MVKLARAFRPFSLILPLALVIPVTGHAQDGAVKVPQPAALQTGEQTPWLYEGSDIPHDPEWLFGKLPSGLRYAVRKNGVPPDQVSIRVLVDAGSMFERESERGFAHLLEHMLFRESKYLGQGEAIPTWQRLGATFGSDTNAQTSPTQTVFKLDLPNVTTAKFDQSMKLLSGMIREPVLSDRNVAAERPIVLAEMREQGGANYRVGKRSRETIYAGQLLAERDPIGTEATLGAATGASVSAFYQRWYRPENTVVVVAGDLPPEVLAGEVEKYFADWKVAGAPAPAPSFGDPVAPAGADPANPVGETAVLVEPDLPRRMSYAILRPWRPVQDTIVYNEGLLRDWLALAIINRRLEKRARSGSSFLLAQVAQDDVSRSADTTYVEIAPLSADWKAALDEVRGVIADAVSTPPSDEELQRELAEFDVSFAGAVEQRRVMAGAKLADDLINAIDIRETVASPETVQMVFNRVRGQVTPEEIREHAQALFTGTVVRGVYVTPSTGEADAQALQAALRTPAKADASARSVARQVRFEDLPPVGKPGEIARQGPIGVMDIERVDFANGVRALVWANQAEPGRIAVKVRFGGGYRSLRPNDAAYATLGQIALVGSGVGELSQDDLDQVTTGRSIGFGFGIDDDTFTLTAQTRRQDLADQLYLFAAKLQDPRWDAAPVERAKAAATLTFESFATSPAGVLGRDLDWLLHGRDPRFLSPTPQDLAKTSPQGFKEAWNPRLAEGPIEILLFGDFDKAEGIEALRRTFGALPPRKAAALGKPLPGLASGGETVVEYHRGDANQAAAVIAWPSGSGTARLPEGRQLELLTAIFQNRLLDALRERAGASYAPQVSSDWPNDPTAKGSIRAIAQLKPSDVPVFFQEAERIARSLAETPVSEDELQRATEPLLQTIRRASTGNTFWLYMLEGATTDPQIVPKMRTILSDYTVSSPAAIQALAAKYFGGPLPWRMAVIPQGQELATKLPAQDGAVAGR